jgi:hypothetical protein
VKVEYLGIELSLKKSVVLPCTLKQQIRNVAEKKNPHSLCNINYTFPQKKNYKIYCWIQEDKEKQKFSWMSSYNIPKIITLPKLINKSDNISNQNPNSIVTES